MHFQKWSVFFRCVLAKSNLALFAPWGEASVFALVKSSLDCRLSQWHVYLLESVLHLARCCERVFLYHGEDLPIVHHCCPPWTSRPFYVAELTSALFFSSELTKLLATPNVPAISLMDLFCFWIFTCMENSFDRMMWVHSNSFQMQWHNQLQTFYLLSWCRNNKRITQHLSTKQILSQLSNYLWSLEKGGRYTLKSCNSLTFPPILMRTPSN